VTPDNLDFNAALREELEATLLAGDRVNPADPELVLSLESPDWEPALADILGDWRWPPIWGSNRHYRFDQLKLELAGAACPLAAPSPGWTPPCWPSQGRCGSPSTSPIRSGMGWENEANFVENGFGLAARCGGELVSWCLADVTVGDACEIGIETAVPAHRRRGSGRGRHGGHGGAFFQQAGYRHIGWHCEASNQGSIKTAEKVGFVLERPYHDYTFIYDEPRHYAELGRFLLLRGPAVRGSRRHAGNRHRNR
jgi:hypothetical protein